MYSFAPMPLNGGHDVVRQFRGVHLEAESRMRRAADRALALGPTQRIEAEGWPVFIGSATRVDLLLESQEHQMTGLMRAKARDLDVVVQQIGRTRDEVVSAREEPFLRIESGTPGEGCPDLQVLTERMAHHVRGEHAFGRIHVVSAARGVNVMVARPPAELCGIDPTLDLKARALSRTTILAARAASRLHDRELLRLRNRFRTAPELHLVRAGRKLHEFTISAVHLRVEREVGRQALGARRIHAALRVANDECRDRRRTRFVAHPPLPPIPQAGS